MEKILKLQDIHKFFLDAQKAYLAQEYSQVIQILKNPTIFDPKFEIDKKTISLYQYIFCYSIIESKNIDLVPEAILLLQNIDKDIKNSILAIYFLLAKAHCMFFRFNEALQAINDGEKLFHKKVTETFYIPDTNIAIIPYELDIQWLQLKTECLSWHLPDAVCALLQCNHFTFPYTSPNKFIFFRDPLFDGMVVIKCNNKDKQCSLKYHQSCWKIRKSKISELEKISEKDILGFACLTPNCMNDNVPSIISLIQIVDKTGKIKSELKISKKIFTKGAIKKTKLCSLKKQQISTTKCKNQSKGGTPNNSYFREQKTNSYNGDYKNQILIVNEKFNSIDLSQEFSEDVEKNFLFSFFYQYIKSSAVSVNDVYTKFSQFNLDMNFKNFDILKFLLDTNKFDLLNNKDSLESNKITNQTSTLINHPVSNYDANIVDVYDDLMDGNSDENKNTNITHNQNVKTFVINEDFHEDSICNKELKIIDPTCCNSAAGGDSKLVQQNNEFYALLSNVETRGSKHRKLKEFITQLEYQLANMDEENCSLKKKLINKELLIESFEKEQEKYNTVYEYIKDFKNQFEILQEENLEMKGKIIDLVKEKEMLEEKFLESSNPANMRGNVIKIFKEEFKILEDSINSDWSKKIEKLEKSLKTETETKINLMKNCINYCYTSNKNILIGQIQQCQSTLDTIYKINNWLQKTMTSKYLINYTQWVKRMFCLETVVVNMKDEYSQYLKILESGDTEKINFQHMIFNSFQEFPVLQETISDVVIKSLDIFYTNQCQIMQSVLKSPYIMPKYQPQITSINEQNAVYAAGYPYSTPVLPMAPIPPVVPETIEPVVPATSEPVVLAKAEPFAVFPIHQQPTKVKHDLQQKPTDLGSNLETNEHVEKVNLSNETENTKNETAIVESNLSNFQYKIAKMRRSLKTLSIEEHIKPTNSAVEEIKSSIDENVNENSFKTISVINEMLEKSPNSTEKVLSQKHLKAENGLQKKIGYDALLKIMQEEYSSAFQAELIDIIEEIRRNHNGCLSGMTIKEIFKESEQHFQRLQHSHLLSYCLQDDTNINETAAKSSDGQHKNYNKELSSPAFCNCLKTEEDKSKLLPKKTWNILPKEEKWSSKNKEQECSICLSEDKTKIWYTLSCQHSFHKMCIKQWLKNDHSCPNCRVTTIEDEDFPPLPA